jgi:hypothetical protein
VKLIELREPEPRAESISYTEFQYQFTRTIPLDPPEQLPAVNVFHVLEQRCSRRVFRRLRRSDVSYVLWFSAKRRSAIVEHERYLWQHAPSPSAGGRHPVDIFILGIAEDDESVFLYEPISHALRELSGINEAAREQLQRVAKELARADGDGTTFWFGVQALRTASVYKNPESLIWRDSGALLATVAIAAEALSLNCCALGASGSPWLEQLVDAGEAVVGTGGCVLGLRSSTAAGERDG